jgi:hypothetical protein
MKQLIADIIGLITNFNKIDFLLYFAVLILLILVVSLIYIINNDDDYVSTEDDSIEYNNEDIDLKEVVNNIENSTPSTIELTKYEEEQEEKAIISYDELIKKNKIGNVKYDNEEIINDEVSVKKIDLNNIIEESNKRTLENSTSPLYKYEKEEAFLQTLKNISELLN